MAIDGSFSAHSEIIEHAVIPARVAQLSLRSASLLLIAVAFISVWFGTLDYRKLGNPKEGRFAEYRNSQPPVFGIGTYNQTLALYLGRTATLVACEDEFAFGLRQESTRRILTIDQFEHSWRRSANAIVVFPRALLPDIQRRGLDMIQIASTVDDVVVRSV